MRQRCHYTRPSNCDRDTHGEPRRGSNSCKHTRYSSPHIYPNSNTCARATRYPNANPSSPYTHALTCTNPRSVTRPNTCIHS